MYSYPFSVLYATFASFSMMWHTENSGEIPAIIWLFMMVFYCPTDCLTLTAGKCLTSYGMSFFMMRKVFVKWGSRLGEVRGQCGLTWWHESKRKVAFSNAHQCLNITISFSVWVISHRQSADALICDSGWCKERSYLLRRRVCVCESRETHRHKWLKSERKKERKWDTTLNKEEKRVHFKRGCCNTDANGNTCYSVGVKECAHGLPFVVQSI